MLRVEPRRPPPVLMAAAARAGRASTTSRRLDSECASTSHLHRLAHCQQTCWSKHGYRGRGSGLSGKWRCSLTFSGTYGAQGSAFTPTRTRLPPSSPSRTWTSQMPSKRGERAGLGRAGIARRAADGPEKVLRGTDAERAAAGGLSMDSSRFPEVRAERRRGGCGAGVLERGNGRLKIEQNRQSISL